MILVILGICIALLIAGFLVWSAIDDDIGCVVSFIGGFGLIPALIATIALSVSVSNLKVIDEKITMYQEENTKIEQQIATAVESYQKYESDIIAECSPESSITLVALYPELQADTLVQKQIDVYVKNNEEIKHLREKKINSKVTRWWLYFGDGE